MHKRERVRLWLSLAQCIAFIFQVLAIIGGEAGLWSWGVELACVMTAVAVVTVIEFLLE